MNTLTSNGTLLEDLRIHFVLVDARQRETNASDQVLSPIPGGDWILPNFATVPIAVKSECHYIDDILGKMFL